MSQSSTITRRPRLDRLCAEAIDLARAAAEETGEGVGEHRSVVAEGDRVATHFFECLLPGYRGWQWAVVVARASRARNVTVSEAALLPGDDALVPPAWVPWAERLRAGDVGVGDLLPTDGSDERLDPAYVMSDDDAVEDVAFELGVGRARVMSRQGRAETANRWYDSSHGPGADISTSAPADARCGTCGFYLPLAGSMRQLFGACGNLYASDDGRVVSADHGCGAHSEVLGGGEVSEETVDHLETVYDDNLVERVEEAPEADPESVPDAEQAPGTAEPVSDVEVVAASAESAKEPVADPVEPVAETEDVNLGFARATAFAAAVMYEHRDGARDSQRRAPQRAVDPPGAPGGRQFFREQ